MASFRLFFFVQWNHKKCFIHIGMDVTITYCIAMETVKANSEGKQHRKSHSKKQCNWFSQYPVLNVSRVYEKCNQSQISTNLIIFMIEIWSDFRFFFLLDISFQMCFFLDQTLFFHFVQLVRFLPLNLLKTSVWTNSSILGPAGSTMSIVNKWECLRAHKTLVRKSEIYDLNVETLKPVH